MPSSSLYNPVALAPTAHLPLSYSRPKIYFWSSLSDKIGRKPVIILGLTGVTLSATCFGLARSLLAMIVARSIAGALSGNAAVISSMIGEITDETNQGMGESAVKSILGITNRLVLIWEPRTAFPLIGVTWNIGCVV